ncbi:helix-turn-helix transcriptional regulator [Nonomuraea sp. B1E8]|uniref:helix-turn-helix transcriptional regulator n=1 Tax=unclassified Nonomuraea TaxID=2593643 RepID=UPI00325CEA97
MTVAEGPGRLRREELAELAGLSVDYVVRLEQGRATSPSAQVVAGLARALQLDPAERDHAYRLAGLLPPREGTISTHVPAGAQRMLARIEEFPVAVCSADWTLLSWTPVWAALLGDPSARTRAERNLVRAVFTTGPSGLAAWPVLHDGDTLNRALVADLRSTSAEFARLWDEGAVGRHVSARKTIVHPQVGEVARSRARRARAVSRRSKGCRRAVFFRFLSMTPPSGRALGQYGGADPPGEHHPVRGRQPAHGPMREAANQARQVPPATRAGCPY